MRRRAAYAMLCALVLGLFTFGKYYGLSLSDGTSGNGGGHGGSGVFYTGTSGGSHK